MPEGNFKPILKSKKRAFASTKDFAVRLLTTENSRELCYGWKSVFNACCGDTDISMENLNTAFLRYSSDKNYISLLCEKGSDGVGLVNLTITTTSFGKRVAYFEDFYVVEHIRKSRCAALLLDSIRGVCQAEGISSISGKTRPDNNEARSVYDKVATKSNWLIYEKDFQEI